jgi:hypothetical protein
MKRADVLTRLRNRSDRSWLWLVLAVAAFGGAAAFTPEPLFAGFECLTDPGSGCCFNCDTGDKENCSSETCLMPNRSWFIAET